MKYRIEIDSHRFFALSLSIHFAWKVGWMIEWMAGTMTQNLALSIKSNLIVNHRLFCYTISELNAESKPSVNHIISTWIQTASNMTVTLFSTFLSLSIALFISPTIHNCVIARIHTSKKQNVFLPKNATTFWVYLFFFWSKRRKKSTTVGCSVG